MNKAERLARYRCEILRGRFADGRVLDVEYVENAALAMLRAETAIVDRECDIGSCERTVIDPLSGLCHDHLRERTS